MHRWARPVPSDGVAKAVFFAFCWVVQKVTGLCKCGMKTDQRDKDARTESRVLFRLPHPAADVSRSTANSLYIYRTLLHLSQTVQSLT